MKIFGLGFQKTGTTTLAECLRILNFKVCDTRPDLLYPLLNNQFHKRKVQNILNKYDAFEDFPWPLFYQKWYEMYPNAFFIHTVREENSWYNSLRKHINTFKSPMHSYVYGLQMEIPPNKKTAINIYHKHNIMVENFFLERLESNYLKIDFNDNLGWKPITDFLGLEIPNIDFPHMNKDIQDRKDKSSTQILIKQLKFKFLRQKLKFMNPNSYSKYLE